jgi:hypothetical protein
MVHTPVHASWPLQVEIFFSIVQRKVVTPHDSTDLDQVQDRLAAFERRYNETARPFRRKFTPARPQGPTGPDRDSRTERAQTPACPANRSLSTPTDLRSKPLSEAVPHPGQYLLAFVEIIALVDPDNS